MLIMFQYKNCTYITTKCILLFAAYKALSHTLQTFSLVILLSIIFYRQEHRGSEEIHDMYDIMWLELSCFDYKFCDFIISADFSVKFIF